MPPPDSRRFKRKKHRIGSRGRQHRDGNDARGVLPSIEGPPTPPADSPSPRPRPPGDRKRRRNRNDEGGRAHRRRRFTSTTTSSESEVEMEVCVKEIDRTYQYDPYDVELVSSNACLPWLNKDPSGNYPPPTDRSKIDNSILKPLITDLKFPDVYDDEPEWVKIEYQRPKKSKGKKAKRARFQEEQDNEFSDHEYSEEFSAGPSVGPNQELPREPTPPPTEQPKAKRKPRPKNAWERQAGSKFISSLPLEVRMLVYRELLVAPEPVTVYGNWTKIYKRRKANISIQLIKVCRAIYEEAIPILYGGNVFRYLIRDAVNTTATLGNTYHPALTAGNHGSIEEDEEDESDPEWEEDNIPARNRGSNAATTRATRRSARQKKAASEEPDINVEKFAPYFRHIMVEAEAVRYDEATQSRMAEAIEIFQYKYVDDSHMRLSIQTLAIRVTPSRQQASENGYTFVDFFDPGSTVINAVKKVDCRWLRIDVRRYILNQAYGDAEKASEQDVAAIRVDFSHQRLAYNINKYGVEDIWENDDLMRYRRTEQIRQGRLLLEGLAGRVREVCQLADDGQSGDVAESEEQQINFEDDDGWPMDEDFPGDGFEAGADSDIESQDGDHDESAEAATIGTEATGATAVPSEEDGDGEAGSSAEQGQEEPEMAEAHTELEDHENASDIGDEIQVIMSTTASVEQDGEEISHEKIGHEEVGHEEVGHEEVGHEEVGHEEVGHEEVGHEGISNGDTNNGGTNDGTSDDDDDIGDETDDKAGHNEEANNEDTGDEDGPGISDIDQAVS